MNLDRQSGYPKGYAFVEYEKPNEASAAIKAMNNVSEPLLGQKLKVDFAFKPTPPDGSSDSKMEE